jgi:hypothetical protein
MRRRRLGGAIGGLALALIAACSNPLGRQYEYEEQLYLSVNGSATVVIDASIAALVALRGMSLDPSIRTSVDREKIRALFETNGCEGVDVGQPWVRRGRRFVQVHVTASRVRDLERCAPLSWSRYQFTREADTIEFVQDVGPPTPGDPGDVNWNGSELVGFKLHAPSTVFFHNVRRLEDGTAGAPARGNILTWEQRLADRRAGAPIRMEVRMGAESILFRTLWLFASAFAAAVAVLGGLIWITVRRARRRGQPPVG